MDTQADGLIIAWHDPTLRVSSFCALLQTRDCALNWIYADVDRVADSSSTSHDPGSHDQVRNAEGMILIQAQYLYGKAREGQHGWSVLAR